MKMESPKFILKILLLSLLCCVGALAQSRGPVQYNTNSYAITPRQLRIPNWLVVTNGITNYGNQVTIGTNFLNTLWASNTVHLVNTSGGLAFVVNTNQLVVSNGAVGVLTIPSGGFQFDVSGSARVSQNFQANILYHLNGTLAGTVLGDPEGDGEAAWVLVSSAMIDNNAVGDTDLRDSAALSVIGRSANSSGDPADIVASANGEVLIRTNDTVRFGKLGLTNDSFFNVTPVGQTDGQVLTWNGTHGKWTNATPAAGSGGSTNLDNLTVTNVTKLMGLTLATNIDNGGWLKQRGKQTNDSDVQVNATVTATNGFVGPGICPIGTILPWAKTLSGTPALPNGWKECDGSTVSDSSSVYNGVAVPNLNGNNNFLRGNSTSGGTGGAATHTHTFSTPAHTHWMANEVETVDLTFSSVEVVSGSGVFVVENDLAGTVNFTDDITGAVESDVGGTTAAGSSLPPYYNVVYIIRIK